ncbi:M15 family metallopeptidase [Ochrobactrum chromiisoli]|uniref:M15 family metallopeptidase n=1 Tax=Ochrobactrum chromiisoli TaxID=2993941 RepID=A0ABT3QUJ2_9HYPH|nr:M15 family metallopeptidase [Ochrobactrum chromiisoli]MCX2699258.1 M15 family metallopeptidase [Ochrobactrum chromiisoli]
MTATVIRDFLVSLGYQVNKASEQSFNDSLKKTAGNAVKLGLAIEAAAAAVTGAVVKMAQGMEQSYYQSKRLGGSVKDINAISYSLSQVGGNADAAKQSMENIASFMRRLPGGKSYIQKLVGSSVDAGNVPAVMGALAKQFANMPFAQAKVRADFLGIDDDTLQAMIRDGGRYYDEYQKLAKRAGVDQQKYAEDSKDLMVKVRSLGMSFDLLSQKIGTALIGKAGPYIDKFKNWIDRNFDSITKTVTKVADVVIKLSDTIGTFVTRAMEWYDKLDPKSKNVANTIAAIAGAVWLFNKAFNASPVGIILALGAALVALYQDYQNWKETGDKGLVDWDKWEPTIESVTGALETISGWFETLAGDQDGSIGALQIAMAAFATYMATKWASSLLSTFSRVGLGWKILAAYVAYDLMKPPEQVIQDMSDRSAWVDNNVEDSWWGKAWGRTQNAVRKAVGLEPTRNEDGSVKRPKLNPNLPVGARQTAEGKALAPIKTSDGRTALVAAEHQEQFQGFIEELEASGYKVNSLGGYANRQNVNNPRRKSEHAHGNAIDINPAQNPNGRTLITDMPANISQLAKKWGLGWGGDWKSVKDAMHFSAGEREGGRTLSSAELQALRKESAKKRDAKKQKDQADFIVDRLSSLPDGGLPMSDGPFMPNGVNPSAPLLPNNVANSSSASMTMKTEINIMGNADAKQVGGAVEKAGGNLLRNMQPAIR